MSSREEGRQEAAVALPKTEVEKLRDELHLMKTAGIIEVAVRNPSVAEYMSHWEERATKAESALSAPVPIVVFGEGKVVVDTGTAHGRPAVFIAPASNPGEVGASAAREGHDLHSLQPGEIVLTFPTDEQARAVEAALIPAKPAVEVVEARIDKAITEALNALRMEHVGRAYDILLDAVYPDPALQVPATPDAQT